jgi:hypothetical protein
MANVKVRARQIFVPLEKPDIRNAITQRLEWRYTVGPWVDMTHARAMETFKIWKISEAEGDLVLALAKGFGSSILYIGEEPEA